MEQSGGELAARVSAVLFCLASFFFTKQLQVAILKKESLCFVGEDVAYS